MEIPILFFFLLELYVHNICTKKYLYTSCFKDIFVSSPFDYLISRKSKKLYNSQIKDRSNCKFYFPSGKQNVWNHRGKKQKTGKNFAKVYNRDTITY